MQNLDDVFFALADPTRRAILALIEEHGELRPSMLAKHTRRSRPLVSQHLATLVAAGLLVRRAIGRRSWYSIDPRPLARARAWIALREKKAKKQRR